MCEHCATVNVVGRGDVLTYHGGLCLAISGRKLLTVHSLGRLKVQ